MAERIAQRYQVEKTLGKGGTAVVYQVLDTTSDKRLALKRLIVDRENPRQEEIAKLFEYEFCNLAQLVHPRIIEVYDFGKDDNGLYYTMELLEGGDLRELSPLPWKKACCILFDICSALGLIHSRRQVHRDLSPRNIRCTRDFKAKLIDFGAMTPMGPCKQIIGTPPLTPPEVLTLQSLDARADLYSVGGTLYYGLTGRHAYPARSFDELRDLWRSKPRPPSAYVSDIPKELDDLVLGLLNIDRMGRSVNAAEVMERLSALVGVEVDDQLIVRQAYLSMPTLVGREGQVMRVRKLLGRALRSYGAALLVEGNGGVGRSRFLDACVLEGKLGGAVVLKADSADGRGGNWGTVRALISALLETLPELAIETARPYARILGHALPELLVLLEEKEAHAARSCADGESEALAKSEPSDDEVSSKYTGKARSLAQRSRSKIVSSIPPLPFDNPQEIRPRVQMALRDWILQISERRCLMVIVDDIHRVDEPSAAFFALLANQASEKMLMVVVTVESNAPAVSDAAIKLIRRVSDTIRLHALSLEQTYVLLGSVFGDVPNLRLLTDRLYTVTRGNCRAVLQLTQHLVDRGLINYQSGGWTLPTAINSSDLPSNMDEALKERLRKLSPDAFALAQTLALSPEQSFAFEECLRLSEHGVTSRVISNLDELVAIELLTTDGVFYALSQPGWALELTRSLSEERKRTLHARLAQTFEARSELAETIEKRGVESISVSEYLLSSGARERAVDVYLNQYETLTQRLIEDPRAFSAFYESLPKHWGETLTTLLRACEALGRPRKQRDLIKHTLCTLKAISGSPDKAQITALIYDLYRDCGLVYYRDLDPSLAPADRLSRAFEMAQAHYDATPDSERGLTPADAIRYLTQTIIPALGVAGNAFDYSLVASLPSLAPLIPLSAAFEIVDKNVQSTAHLTAARMLRAREGFLEVLERLAAPDRGGIEDSYYEYTRLTAIYTVGIIEASLGMPSALNWVAELDSYPLFQVNGVRIQMVYYLRQGDIQQAEEYKKRLELLQIQNSPSQFYEGGHLFPELLVYSAADDLNGVKQTLDGLQNMGAQFEVWQAIYLFALGEYQRIRGDYKKALSEFEPIFNCAKPGQHVIWPYLASAHTNTLYEAGRLEDARDAGCKFLKAAEEADLDISCNLILRSLLLAEAKLGACEEAINRWEKAIEEYKDANITGISLGLAYEVRARMAIIAGDERDFTVYAQQCAAQYKPGRNPALIAKYEKLVHEAQRAELRVPDDVAHAADATEPGAAMIVTMVAGLLSECRGPHERADRALEVLVEQTHCQGGFLYTIQKDGPVLAARVGSDAVPDEMDEMVTHFLAAEVEDVQAVTMQIDSSERSVEETSEWTITQREKYRPLVLGHHTKEGYSITGLAVMIRTPDRLFYVPSEAVAALSKSLLEAGDVTALLAAS